MEVNNPLEQVFLEFSKWLQNLLKIQEVVPLMTYDSAIKYFVTDRPSDSRVKKGAILRQHHKQGYHLAQVFLDSTNNVLCSSDGKPYGRQLVAREVDEELKETFGNFEQLVITEQVKDDLLLAVDLIQLESKVFDDWGLRQIEPFPRTALNFYGSPGTGKTLSAHAIASKIQRPILAASYAQIESMYHGEGPKNLEAIFLAAERDNALLFIDEADSLLSKRLTNVTQGSEQAINSMRSQLLICLEQFSGVVIFSTNLVENYDKAFETRVRHVRFLMPDFTCRREIWKRHLPNKLPLSYDVSLEILAQVEDVCGRDIKNAVIDAAMRVARKDKKIVELSDLLDSIERIKSARINVTESKKLSPQIREQISQQLKSAIA